MARVLKFGHYCPKCQEAVDITSSDWNRCSHCGYPEVILDDDEDDGSCDGIQEFLNDEE